MENPRLKKAIKKATQLAYDKQVERIQLSNKITRKYKAQKQLDTGEKKNPIYGVEEDNPLLQNLLNQKEELPEEEKTLLEKYLLKQKEEEEAFDCIKPLIQQTKIFQEYLSKFPGFQTGIIGVLIGWLDIQRAKYPSSFWNYAGLTPPKTTKKSESTVKSFQDLPKEVGSTHNPFVKAKIIGELGKILIQENSPWAKTYTDYKTKIANDPKKIIRSRNHLHNMAARFTIKRFLKDLHIEWRRIEGMPEPIPFQKRTQDKTEMMQQMQSQNTSTKQKSSKKSKKSSMYDTSSKNPEKA